MDASFARLLAEATIASTMALLIVAVLRKPLRHTAGAQSAYWVWLLVPATALAVFLPAPTYTPQALSSPLPIFIGEALSTAVLTVSAGGHSMNYLTVGLATWLLGASLMAAIFVIRQWAFVRALGNLDRGPDHVFRSNSAVGPMVVGVVRARVIVPTDFEVRFTHEECSLMLAHERAHLERGDTLIYAIATGWLCLFWFNPLMYWALGRLRFDQDLACDALALSRSRTGKSLYAKTLLKAQMPNDSAWRTPVGCHWKSSHPLKERIAMLKYQSPGRIRRVSGVATAVALSVFGMYAVTFAAGVILAQNSSTRADKSPIPPSLESSTKLITIDAQNTDTRKVLMMIASESSHNILVSDQVHGKLTVHVKDVPWTKALEIVALSQGLVTKQSGDITLVDVAH
jgi:bla regulator protein BlaR1